MDKALKRNNEVDFIKGLLIILMIFGHISHSNEILINIVDYIYIFHMPIFLFLSGYYFNLKRKPLQSITITMNKIFIPYIIFITIYLFILYYVNQIGLQTSNYIGHISLVSYLNYVFIEPIGAYWFLHTLILFSLIVYITLLTCKSNINITFIIILFSFLLIFIDLFKDTTYLTFLILGLIFKLIKLDFLKNLSPLFIIIYCLLIFSTQEIKEDLLIRIIIVFSIMSVLFYIASKVNKFLFFNIISFFGKNTLIILLVHIFFINLTKIFKSYILILDSTGILFSIVSIIITIVGSLLTSIIFDKLKLTQYIFRVETIYSPYKNNVVR